MAKICPQLLATGTCVDSTCSYQHDLHSCDICGVMCSTASALASHTSGKKHRNRVAGKNNMLHCSICERNVMAHNWRAHVFGGPHTRAANSRGISGVIKGEDVVTDIPGNKFCDLCRVHIPDNLWSLHIRSRFHKRQEGYQAMKAVFDEAARDKNGVTIEGVFNFDIIEPTVGATGLNLSSKIKLTVPQSRITLVEVKLASVGRKGVSSSFSVAIDASLGLLKYGKPMNVVSVFKQSHIGRYEDRIEFTFEDVQLKKRFLICRTLRAIIGNKADHQLLRPKAPYVPRERLERQPVLSVVEGIAPPTLTVIPYAFKLPAANIPKPLLSTLSHGSVSEMIRNVRRMFLPSVLDSDSYARHFKHLLWIEEFRMDRDMERYDMTGVTLKQHRSYHYLEVPGLAEKRPSVLVGDRILVQKPEAAKGHWYEGGVHVLHQAEVGLRFHGSFSGGPGQHYNVRFKLNRIPMRRQHQAMDTVFSQERVLFPAKAHLPPGLYPSPVEKRLKLFNPLLAKNNPQLQAVISIVNQPPGSVPFVVFGPPGTGKTITMVEAIQQVLLANPKAKVLACAPSNSAADLIASRLSRLSTDELFRFYAPSRFKNQVPDELLPYAYLRDDTHFSVPPLARMKQFRVIITTCVSASVISGIGIPRGHYSHIFIDEAGHATEPEVFISVKTMADNSTNIVLSGDPKQLGPIIRSGVARELGLEKSYIERLMDRDVYDIQTGYGRSVIKLVKNFRSHQAILKFPNENFYNGDLQQCGDPGVINSFIGSPFLPAKKFPIIFHGISGKDDRESSSPSFFNIDEVSQVKAYVEKLRAERQFRVTDHDIGIITPYHAQCLKIRAVLKAVADEIKVGSVEEFQGQERRVIIISTVRSSKEFVEYDLRHTLGFVANPRRFNVAVTRAKALLIVVGDPQVLSLDPLWRSFLNYVHSNNGWTGQPPTWDTSVPVNPEGGYDRIIREEAQLDMNDFSRRLEALTIAGTLDEDTEALEVQVDRPWRDME
ncbi:P-loop containing nucleoside triphosphate hydrolase protein [Collybia nuda]|uniref:RNA helicase n=1 Tax=Collybia nuda TaxID=64659 RepID=A0A9P5XWL7_9AGAR|nr:P-loop containing nucleoside triphosphate hydrolase protein [Collybia nuda]